MNPTIIGNATLYLGDCLEILPSLKGVDAVITDPPYGIGESQKKVLARVGLAAPIDYGNFTWDKAPASKDRIDACVSAAKVACIFGGNYFNLPPASKWLVWDKLNTGDFADAELAWTNAPGAVRVFRHLWNGMIRGSERDVKRIHPTQKPVAVMQWCISQVGTPAATIADPFMGSGSTGVAAMKMDRRFIGIEIDPDYFAIACDRIEKAQRQGRMEFEEAA